MPVNKNSVGGCGCGAFDCCECSSPIPLTGTLEFPAITDPTSIAAAVVPIFPVEYTDNRRRSGGGTFAEVNPSAVCSRYGQVFEAGSGTWDFPSNRMFGVFALPLWDGDQVNVFVQWASNSVTVTLTVMDKASSPAFSTENWQGSKTITASTCNGPHVITLDTLNSNTTHPTIEVTLTMDGKVPTTWSNEHTDAGSVPTVTGRSTNVACFPGFYADYSASEVNQGYAFQSYGGGYPDTIVPFNGILAPAGSCHSFEQTIAINQSNIEALNSALNVPNGDYNGWTLNMNTGDVLLELSHGSPTGQSQRDPITSPIQQLYPNDCFESVQRAALATRIEDGGSTVECETDDSLSFAGGYYGEMHIFTLGTDHLWTMWPGILFFDGSTVYWRMFFAGPGSRFWQWWDFTGTYGSWETPTQYRLLKCAYAAATSNADCAPGAGSEVMVNFFDEDPDECV